MDKKDHVHENFPVRFELISNGPIYAKGTFKIINSNGKIIEINSEAWLCRCGKSKNKPFCDESHKKS